MDFAINCYGEIFIVFLLELKLTLTGLTPILTLTMLIIFSPEQDEANMTVWNEEHGYDYSTFCDELEGA